MAGNLLIILIMMKLMLALIFGLTISAHAYESDQHTVPDQELADVGGEMSSFIYNQIKTAITKINLDLKELPEKIQQIQ